MSRYSLRCVRAWTEINKLEPCAGSVAYGMTARSISQRSARTDGETARYLPPRFARRVLYLATWSSRKKVRRGLKRIRESVGRCSKTVKRLVLRHCINVPECICAHRWRLIYPEAVVLEPSIQFAGKVSPQCSTMALTVIRPRRKVMLYTSCNLQKQCCCCLSRRALNRTTAMMGCP